MTQQEIKYYGMAPNKAGSFDVFACHKTEKQTVTDILGRQITTDRQEVIGTYSYKNATKIMASLNRALSVERFGC